MRQVCRLALTAMAWMLVATGFAAANDAVSCVQDYLSKAGYPIGRVDGQLGKRTLGYAAEFDKVYYLLKLPDLDKETAPVWCEIVSSEAGQAVLATRDLPAINAPEATVGRNGGLNFAHALVKENFSAPHHHGFEASLRPGRVTVDIEPARVHSGKSSIRMHILTGDCGWTTHRGADEWNDCKPYGNERVETEGDPVRAGKWYYGLSIMLAKNIFDLPGFNQPLAHSEINLYQWYQFDSGACFDIMFNTRLKTLNISSKCSTGKFDDSYLRVLLPDSRPDVWHEFVVEANWATGDDGYFRVLQNGKMVMNYAGPTIVPEGQKQIAEHPQIYRYGSTEYDSATTQYRTATTVWFDDMMRSKTLKPLHAKYDFEDAALSDFASALPISNLHPYER
jgi:hypothetical protein